jgi:site-specific DNA-adenine methylase
MTKLKAPFPWFGGKSRVAALCWDRFGDPANYVEPFAGSLAVLLGRPTEPKIETVNDLDCYLANFWRALQHDPEAVADAADWPVNEADLHARHLWLVNRAEFRERMKTDPDFYDAKKAGWWVWGQSAWIGGGWCEIRDRPNRRIPHLGDAGRGVHRNSDIVEYCAALADRLRRVRVCCGDWSRVIGDAVTVVHGTTAVFLDPPYSGGIGRDEKLYAEESLTAAAEVRKWAVENGGRRQLRIALCGYEGEHEMPDDWECVAWKAHGGYGNLNKKATNKNAGRERIWFSPGCLRPATLFD